MKFSHLLSLMTEGRSIFMFYVLGHLGDNLERHGAAQLQLNSKGKRFQGQRDQRRERA